MGNNPEGGLRQGTWIASEAIQVAEAWQNGKDLPKS